MCDKTPKAHILVFSDFLFLLFLNNFIIWICKCINVYYIDQKKKTLLNSALEKSLS